MKRQVCSKISKMLRVILFTYLLSPYISNIWNFLSILGIIFFICMTLGYIFLFAFPRSTTRLPLTRVRSLNLSSSSSLYDGAKLRKQYALLSKNGMLSSNLIGGIISNNSFEKSLLYSAVRSIAKDFIKDHILSKSSLRSLLGSLLKAKSMVEEFDEGKRLH